MNIGAASRASGVSAKMIRYYESIGLVRSVRRTGSNYRDYGHREIHELGFIRRARDLGFSLAEIGRLLSLWRNHRRPSRDIKRIAMEHVAALEAKANELKLIADSLRHLARHCRGDDRPDCPILEDLAKGKAGKHPA